MYIPLSYILAYTYICCDYKRSITACFSALQRCPLLYININNFNYPIITESACYLAICMQSLLKAVQFYSLKLFKLSNTYFHLLLQD